MAVLCLFAAPLLVAGLPAAQTFAAEPSAFGDRDMSAPIDLSQAYRLPGIFATDLAFHDESGTLRGSFTAWNNEQSAVGGLQYNVEVRGADNDTLFDRQAVRVPFALAALEKKTVAFSYAPPALPAGSYRLRIQIVTQNGRSLGWEDKDLRVSAGAASFATLQAASVSLPGAAGQQLDPLSGPNVDAHGRFTLQAVAENDGSAILTVTPVLDTYAFDIARGGVSSQNYPSLTLVPGERKTIEVPVDAAGKPEVYSALLRLTSKGRTISSLGEFRWVVKGADADLLPLRVMQIGMKAGDQTVARVDFVGAADAQTRLTGTLQVQLLDDKGILGQASVSGVSLTDSIAESLARITLTRDLAGTPVLRTIITDTAGQLLDQSDIRLAVPAASLVAASAASSRISFAAFVLVILALAAIAYLATRKIPHLALRGAVMAGFTLLLIGGAVGTKTFAAGNGNGIEVFTPEDGSAHFHDLPGPVIALFINAPIHDATYSRNAVPLQYRVTYGVCQNRIGYARVLGRVDVTGAKQSTLAGVNADWRIVHNQLYSLDYNTCVSRHGQAAASVCKAQTDFDGTLDLSTVLPSNVCSTTLQMVAKLGQSGLSPANGQPQDIPDSSVVPAPPGGLGTLGFRWGHAVNLWLNFDCSGSSSSSRSSSSAAPQCSDGIDNDGDGLIDRGDPGCHTDGNVSNIYSYDANDNSEYNSTSGGQTGDGNGQSNGNANTTVNNQVNNAAQNNTVFGGNANWWGSVTVTPTANATVNNQVNAGAQNTTVSPFGGNWWGSANTTVNNQVNNAAQNNTLFGANTNWWGSPTVTPTANATVNNQVNAGAQTNVGWRW